MPRTKAQFAEMRKATREKIHTVSIKLFTQKGFAATSVQDIAISAETSTGLMYRYYKSKEALFGALVVQAADGLRELTARFQSDQGTPIDLITDLTAEMILDIKENDEFAQFMSLIPQAFMMEEHVPQVKELSKQHNAMIEETARLITKGQKLDQFKQGDPMEMAIYYFAAIQGIAEMRFALKKKFITPSLKLVLAFLVKDDIVKNRKESY